MASPPILTPSGTTGFNLQTWTDTAEPSTYQKMVAIPIIEDYGKRLMGTGNIRKTARVTSTVLGQSADGTSLTPSNIIGTPVTLTAVGNYIMIQWSENEDAQIDLNLDQLAASEIERALAEGSDQSVLSNAASGTNIMSQAAVDGPMWRQGIFRLMGNTNGMAAPGGTKTIYAIFSHTQGPALCTMTEYLNAMVRGDSENPYVTGIFFKAQGVLLNLSTVVYQDGNGWHNILFTDDAFRVGWNVRTRIKRQDFELTNKVIIYNNFGSNLVHDTRVMVLRTTASQL